MSPPAAGPAMGLRFPLGPWDLVTHQTRSGTHHPWIWETRVIEIAILSLITRCRGHLSSGCLVSVTKEALEYSSSQQGPAGGRGGGRHVRSLCSRTRPSLHSDKHPARAKGIVGTATRRACGSFLLLPLRLWKPFLKWPCPPACVGTPCPVGQHSRARPCAWGRGRPSPHAACCLRAGVLHSDVHASPTWEDGVPPVPEIPGRRSVS